MCLCAHVEMWSRDGCDSSGSDQSHGVMKPTEYNKIQKNTHTSRRGRLTLKRRMEREERWAFYDGKAFSNVLMLPHQSRITAASGIHCTYAEQTPAQKRLQMGNCDIEMLLRAFTRCTTLVLSAAANLANYR